MTSEVKLWLWKNFVDGKPEYWAFDSLYPTIDGGDPATLGEPCGYVLLKSPLPATARARIRAEAFRSVAAWLRKQECDENLHDLQSHTLLYVAKHCDHFAELAETDGYTGVNNGD